MNLRIFFPKQPVFRNHLIELAEKQREIALVFEDFVQTFPNISDHWQKAREIEHSADEKTFAIVNELNQTFILSFDREDVYNLSQRMDDIIDLIENVLHNIHVYRITDNKKILMEFAALISEASQALLDLTFCLKEIKYTERVRSLKIKIHDLETKGDNLFLTAIGNFFANEKDPIQIIKWKDILENLEDIMDKYQEVSNIIEGMMVKFN